jgi:hypothetical protein
MDSSAISWSMKKQELITLLTTKAKYIVATHAAKETKWLYKLLSKLFPHILQLPTTLYCDNQAMIMLATTDNYHSCTKHLNQCFHFIHDMVSQGAIKIIYCPSEDMVTDVLTKALPKWKVVAHSNALGMCRTYGGVTK